MLFTLDELCTRIALTLSSDYAGAPNERVRDVPDRRTVRYYTTLGLIDRPVMHGRTAVYGRKQLLQLVAIKRLQANGLSLREVQHRLLSLSWPELEELARVPSDDLPAADAAPEAPLRREFWKDVPEPAAQAEDAPPEPTVVQGVPLDERVVLLLPLRRTPDATDLESIRVAAEPLLKLLAKRRLIE